MEQRRRRALTMLVISFVVCILHLLLSCLAFAAGTFTNTTARRWAPAVRYGDANNSSLSRTFEQVFWPAGAVTAGVATIVCAMRRVSCRATSKGKLAKDLDDDALVQAGLRCLLGTAENNMARDLVDARAHIISLENQVKELEEAAAMGQEKAAEEAAAATVAKADVAKAQAEVAALKQEVANAQKQAVDEAAAAAAAQVDAEKARAQVATLQEEVATAQKKMADEAAIAAALRAEIADLEATVQTARDAVEDILNKK